MRVLHLFSNSKWTGPAEPALRLCLALRDKGVNLDFACAPKSPSRANMVVDMARAHDLEPLDIMYLTKHKNPLLNWLDARALRGRLDNCAYDLLHCHLDNDHDIALDAVRGGGPPVVRSLYTGDGMPMTRRHRRFARCSAALIEPSEMALQADRTRFRLPAERLFVVANAVDTGRFDPHRTLPNMRARLGIPGNAIVFGIVARMQRHRHYDDLFEAFARLAHTAPESRLLVIGRGTEQDRVAFAHVRRLQLEHHVHFAGYLSGDEYVGALAAFDIGLFLKPGTDGACRAVREIMAMGKPLIVADRGMLREIVAHQRNGLVTDGSPDMLCRAMITLYRDAGLRSQYAQDALKTARVRYALPVQADAVLDIYTRILRNETG